MHASQQVEQGVEEQVRQFRVVAGKGAGSVERHQVPEKRAVWKERCRM
jgi:hypothetical protein